MTTQETVANGAEVSTPVKDTKKDEKKAKSAMPAEGLMRFDPEELTFIDEKGHPLYDPRRVALPVMEELVLNIMVLGVLEPVLIAKDPETGKVVVVDGRQRVKAAREANKRLKKQGSPLVKVPCIMKKAAPGRLAGMMAGTTIRQDETPLGRAENMAKMRDLGTPEEEIAVFYGVSLPTVKNHLSLLVASAPVRNAVEAGKIGTTAAYKLAKLEPEEQKKRLAEAIEAAEGATTKREKSRARNKAVDSGPKMRRRGEIEELLASADNGLVKSVLKWVLGLRERAPKVGDED